VLSDGGGGVLLRQSDMTVDTVCSLLQDFLADPARLSTMAAAASAAATPDAAERVSDYCEELMYA
jgi:UDP-N-acetylglucosamine:LPS N-acetylglucosamine transferase